MTCFYTHVGKIEATSIPKFLSKLSLKIITSDRKEPMKNYAALPSVVEKLVKDNSYVLMQNLLSKFDLLPAPVFDTLPHGADFTVKEIFNKTGIKCRYLLKLNNNEYAPVSEEMFQLFVIEGTLFRKASVEVITQRPEALAVFTLRGSR